MELVQRKFFLLWSKTKEHRQKLNESKKVISESLSMFSKPYVSFSGGKDSTALLHLVLKQDPHVLCFHWDFGRYFLPRKLEKEILRIARRIGSKKVWVETSSGYEIKKREAKEFYKCFFGRVLPLLRKKKFDSVFLGLRKEESVRRKLRLGCGYFEEEGGLTNIYPLRDWTYKDVWAYILSNKIPYLSYYDTYSKLVKLSQLRFSTLFDPEFSHLGSENIDKFLNWRYHNV
jgi:phosphoadenosine phosphosulfate reductase